MKLGEQARINIKQRLEKALESFTLEEIATAYECKLANFSLIVKKIDEDKKINLSTIVRINKALDKLEAKE